MIFKNVANIAIVSAILLSAVSHAEAFSRYSYKNSSGKVVHGIKCDNGDRWISGDGSLAPTDADAKRICVKRGSGMAKQPGGASAKRSQSAIMR